MTSKIHSVVNDLHLHPLYLKWAAERFSEGKKTEGMLFFNETLYNEHAYYGHEVYNQLWKIKGSPEGDPEFGKKAFNSLEGFSSTLSEKAEAINRAIRTTIRPEDHDKILNPKEWDESEHAVYEKLWMVHGRPQGDLEYGRHAFHNTHKRFSIFEDKRKAVRMYADETRALTWITDKEKVHLFKRADGELELVIDKGSEGVRRKLISVENQSTGDLISSFTTYAYDVTADGGVVKVKPLPPCEEWPVPIYYGNNEMKLHWRGDRLIWHMFDKTTKTANWVYANSETILIFEWVRQLPPNKRKSCINYFQFELYFDSTNRLSSVACTFKANDVLLYPLFLKWASEKFREGNTIEGMVIFSLVCAQTKAWEHKVYEQMWKLKGSPKGDAEYGKKAFHGLDGLSSTSPEKAEAVKRVIALDRYALEVSEKEVSSSLWIARGNPRVNSGLDRCFFYNANGQPSSLEEKLKAVKTYAEHAEKSRAWTCFADGKEVRIIKREDGKLGYITIYRSSELLEAGIIELAGGASGEDSNSVIPLLAEFGITTKGREVHFEKFSICEGWPEIICPGNGVVHLLQKDGRFMWRMLDEATKTVSWTSVDETTAKIIATIEFQKRFLPEGKSCKDYLEVTIPPNSNINSILTPSINIKQWPSRLDPFQTIDKCNWTVTLISAGDSSGKLFGLIGEPFFGHAQIIIEGIAEEGLFTHMWHLTAIAEAGAPLPSGHARPRGGILSKKKLKFRAIGPTSVVKKEAIENMIRQILKDRHDNCPFNQLGISAQNCLTWSIDRLALAGIKLPPSKNNIPDSYVNWLKNNPSSVTLDKKITR